MAQGTILQDFVLRAFWGVCGAIPRRAANRIGAALVGVIGPHTARHRKIEQNLAIIFPEKTPEERSAIARNAWREFGRTLSEFPFMERVYKLGFDDNPHYGFDIHPETEALVLAKQPAIYVGAHISNWEFAALGARLADVPLTIVYGALAGGYIDAAVRRARESIGCELIGRADGMRPLIKRMAEGGSLAILIDRRLKAGPETTFFGQPIAFSQAPAKLAMKFDCPIVPHFVSRAPDGKVILHALAPIWPNRVDAASRERAAVVTREIAAILEEEIRKRPGDWFCGQRLWRKAPRPETGKRPFFEIDA